MKWIFPVLLIFIINCSEADSLADEPPIEFQITNPPTYTSGIGQLISEKCGSCHVEPPSPITPNNIAKGLDLNQYETIVREGEVIRGADAIGRWIYDGILDHPVTLYEDTSMPRAMPLDYATPLTQSEKDSLLAWANTGSPFDSQGSALEGNSNNGIGPYFDLCVDCHDIGNGVSVGDGLWAGPAIRRSSVTVAKVKSMWLDKQDDAEPLDDQMAADIAAYILTFNLED